MQYSRVSFSKFHIIGQWCGWLFWVKKKRLVRQWGFPVVIMNPLKFLNVIWIFYPSSDGDTDRQEPHHWAGSLPLWERDTGKGAGHGGLSTRVLPPYSMAAWRSACPLKSTWRSAQAECCPKGLSKDRKERMAHSHCCDRCSFWMWGTLKNFCMGVWQVTWTAVKDH